MKLLRTIRFDDSDTRVFDHAAQPDEWAVSGSSLFGDVRAEALTGKLRQAFANGFLGTATLGHATFVIVASTTEATADKMTSDLTRLLIERLGAPSLAEAESVAAAEVAFVAELCRELEVGRILAVSRSESDDGGISEQFHLVDAPREVSHDIRLWGVDDDA